MTSGSGQSRRGRPRPHVGVLPQFPDAVEKELVIVDEQ